MENASKALLISASILIAILLIAMGVRVFNSTLGTKESVDESMITTEQTMLRNNFSKYYGENKTKADVISLINEIIAYNCTKKSKNYVHFSYKNVVSESPEGISVYWDPAKTNEGNAKVFQKAINAINEADEKHNFTKFKIGVNYGVDGKSFWVCAWPTAQKNQ